MTATLIADRPRDAPVEDAAHRALVRRVKRFILNNLARPELSPQLIAVEHRISVRYLHKLFAGEPTTLSRWILRARLERCRRDLITARAPVAVIAHRWGFTSAARFSRVFGAAFGVSPREFRLAQRDPAARPR
jgi:AraC-like DNA-binding protein